MGSSENNSGGRVPALDGVRGIAILLVLAAHFTLPLAGDGAVDHWMRFIAARGVVGVTLFFVLSGFLITGILMDAKGGGRYFSSFYARRILRIFPLYYAMVALNFVLLPRWAPGLFGISEAERASQVYFWSYLSNFYQAAGGQTNVLMNVSWSLAIEEQFYVLWPLVVALCGRAALAAVCWVLIVGAAASRFALAWFTYGDPMPVFMLTGCRVDALAIGALIAMALRSFGGFVRLKLLAKCLVLPALVAYVAFAWKHWGHWNRLWDQTFGYTVEATLCAVLLIWGIGSIRAQQVLSARWLRFFGHYSYAMYFLHVPAAWAIRQYVIPLAKLPPAYGSNLPIRLVFCVSAMTLTIALAVVSWHLFEKHFLALKRFFPMGKATPRDPVETKQVQADAPAQRPAEMVAGTSR